MPDGNQDEQFKRHIAFKFRIGDILSGKQIFNGERFQNLELDGRNILRVNVVGNIIERFDSSSEKKYSFLTLDDGSGQIGVKAFGDDVSKIKNLTQGQTILVIGVLRSFNNEVYITPEIIRILDSKYLLVRKLEIEKSRRKSALGIPKEQIVAVKDRILNTIKNSEQGIETDQIENILRDISPEIIRQEIQKFLEEGIIFEPRPGRIKYLG